MSKTDVKVPMLYIEGLRMDAYFSIRDVKRLKQLREDYAYHVMVAPVEYRLLWEASRVYCDMKIFELNPR